MLPMQRLIRCFPAILVHVIIAGQDESWSTLIKAGVLESLYSITFTCHVVLTGISTYDPVIWSCQAFSGLLHRESQNCQLAERSGTTV